MSKTAPIGVFDSGYGGLTVLKEFVKQLPQYDYLYLGDNARAPYGSRSFETVYEYTLQCVKYLFSAGCPLVVLACNTASAKALRSIQQLDLPKMKPGLRVLGVIRPTTEHAGEWSKSNHIGIMATQGTVLSNSYPIEIEKFFLGANVYQEACPMWVPLVENNEFNSPGADYFIKKHVEHLLSQSDKIDTIILGCTHYPLLIEKIRSFLPEGIRLISQGEVVAASLKDYLHRHPQIETSCSKGSSRAFLTTDSNELFDQHAAIFFGEEVKSSHITLN